MSKLRLPKELKGQRCILHIDLEQLRLGLSSDSPIAVQQWNGLIAVNYAARKAGIQRHCVIEEAKKKCPDVILVHVATYANQDPEPRYHPSPHYATHKVSLEPYRRASALIFGVFARFCGSLGAKLQKAGIDEAFMDVTDCANQRLTERYGHLFAVEGRPDGEIGCPVEVKWDELGVVVGGAEVEKEEWTKVESEVGVEAGGKVEVRADCSEGLERAKDGAGTDGLQEAKKALPKVNWDDVQLAMAAEIAREIRKAVFDELGYTCSAGVTHNKALAKICSGLNKPNKQTIMRNCAVIDFMRNMPFTKIRNLGGKLGEEVETELGIRTAGDMWKYPKEELQSKFGQATGIWLHNICRGIDFEDVTIRNIPKSMMAAKSFRPPVRDMATLEHWLNVLAAEVFTRIQFDFETHARWPKTMGIHFRVMSESAPRSKSCPMFRRLDLKSPDILAQRALELFRTTNNHFPLINFSLTAGMFEKDGAAEGSDISRFLVRGATAMTQDHAQGESAITGPAAEKVATEMIIAEMLSEDASGKEDDASSKETASYDRGRAKSPQLSSGQGSRSGGIEAFLVRGKQERDSSVAKGVEEQPGNLVRKGERKDIRHFFKGRDKGVAREATPLATYSHEHFGSEPSLISILRPQFDADLRCSICNVQVSESEVLEHLDFHFAVALQDEERRRDRVPNGGVTVPQGGTDSKRGAAGEMERDQLETKRRKRELFFQPRSTGSSWGCFADMNSVNTQEDVSVSEQANLARGVRRWFGQVQWESQYEFVPDYRTKFRWRGVHSVTVCHIADSRFDDRPGWTEDPKKDANSVASKGDGGGVKSSNRQINAAAKNNMTRAGASPPRLAGMRHTTV
ncbi:LOW QUALITY PROTEIN: hypothetical protein BC936DRAFT_141014 [Jimgerdemannia flammicorona]|uniref:DNA polymerase eta n=1 Tax=Jimgerdemannia flammicorona TaxID=994334 RepID=A0A433DMK2_9FUNG|nr:LOW QUALITY PROTEIN: hypothetical protein BC936DRAFT_141014 [Jimgerdemannia flammicorona]